jgi:hypothetical protein
MRGLALHANLAGARFLGVVRTAPAYRLHSISDVHPGMYRVQARGVSVEGELYDVPIDTLARVEAGEPPNLYRGPVELQDGRWVYGILYPQDLAAKHRDISEFGGWRGYLLARHDPAGGGIEPRRRRR